MIATCIHLEETKATVVLRPCWLARLFGLRSMIVDIVCDAADNWRTSGTGRLLHRSLSKDNLILEALDFRPVSQLPEARAL